MNLHSLTTAVTSASRPRYRDIVYSPPAGEFSSLNFDLRARTEPLRLEKRDYDLLASMRKIALTHYQYGRTEKKVIFWRRHAIRIRFLRHVTPVQSAAFGLS